MEEEKPTKAVAEIAAEVAAVEQAKKKPEDKFMNEMCFWENDYPTPEGLPEKHAQYHEEWLANKKTKEEAKSARK
jgi:ubiquitin